MKDSPENIRIGQRPGRPLECVQLKVAAKDVRIHRRELVHANIEVDADFAKILLNHGRLQTVEFGIRDFQRKTKPGLRTVAVGVAIACLIEQCPGARRIVREREDIGGEGPGQGGSGPAAGSARPRRR